MKTFTSEDHFRQMAEFVKGVQLTGGTTPHVTMTVEAMRRIDDPLDQLWFAGCYALVYNWPTAERIFLENPARSFTQEGFYEWCLANWDGVFLRKERKAVYGKPNFATCAATYLNFAEQLVDTMGQWPDDYEAGFQFFTKNVKFMGRYIGVRWLEVMRRMYGMEGWAATDIRSDGGEHPRKMLAMIYPEDAEALLGGNSAREVRVADLAANRLKVDLKLEYDIDVDFYTMHSILCELKQALLGRKHYPGKSIDTEVGYHHKISAYWGEDSGSQFFDIRQACFPEWSLGEINGWTGVRSNVQTLIADHGIVWSDLVHDYHATKDFSNPVLRDASVTSVLEIVK